MIALWPHWFRPWWLLLLPLLGWLLWQLWHRQKRAGRWQMILPPAFHAALLSGGSGSESKLPWVALGLAWTLAVLALLGPSWQRVEQTSQKPVDPLVVLLELTPEMLATDVPPNRLEQARRKLFDLLQNRSDVQTAIVVYSGSAHTLVPLSDDLATSRNLLEALKPSIMPQVGHRADLALEKALTLLEGGAIGQGRVLLIGSSLTEQERQGIRHALALSDQPPQFLMLGIGSREGVPVAQEDGSFLKDEQGAILVSRLDGPSLKAFANELDGRYRQARLDDNDLRGLGLLKGPKSLRNDDQPLLLDTWADQGYWLLLPLLLLAACAGRRGWLFCLPLLFMLPQPSYAFEFNDLWLRPDQQGRHLLEQKRPADAARHFQDPQWQGVALYEAGNYVAAAQRFAEGNDAYAHYNRGNALAKSGELEAALDAYEQALERQPDLRPALTNKALVESLLKQKQPPAQSESGKTQGSEAEQAAQNPPPGAATQPSPGDEQKTETQNPSSSSEPQAHGTPQPGNNEVPGSELGDEHTTTPPIRSARDNFDGEHRQALEQWLRQIPDNPGELLRRKFWYEQQQHQDQGKTR
jgi:Ca-activated chloride channel homolog